MDMNNKENYSMRKVTKNGRVFLLLLVVLFAASSCKDEYCPPGPNPPGDNGGGSKEILINLSVPGSSVSQLRAISPVQEDAFTAVVLAFRVDNGREIFDYSCGDFRPEGSNTNTGRATVLLRPYSQRFVVIANGGTKINEFFNLKDLWKDWVGDEKDVCLSKLEFALADTTKGWNTDGSNYTPFPMWGQTQSTFVVNDPTARYEASIDLLRMVAKIDVVLSTDAKAKFTMSSVRLYNTYTKGRIVPNSGNLTVSNGKIVADKVTLPSDIDSKQYNNFFIDYNSSNLNPEGNMCNAIYTFERKPQRYSDNSIDPLNTTCLVIGGKIQGDPKTYYYRVDFYNKDEKKYLDILRNHYYRVNIKDVKGSGYEDPGTAFESKAFNLDVEILQWKNFDLDVVFDDQYYLSVSKNNFVFSKRGYGPNDRNNTMTIRTDHPSGWYVESILVKDTQNPATWLTVNPHPTKDNPKISDPTIGSDVKFILEPNNGGPRTAVVTFAAGRLRYPVTITQSDQEVSIKFYVFGSRDSQPSPAEVAQKTPTNVMPFYQVTLSEWAASQYLVVTWTPANANLIVYEAPCSISGFEYGQFTYSPSLGLIAGGQGTYESSKGISAWRINPPRYTGSTGKKIGVDCVFVIKEGAIESLEESIPITLEYTGP
jgi:hypothetical protein